jgi:hypothetical protein
LTRNFNLPPGTLARDLDPLQNCDRCPRRSTMLIPCRERRRPSTTLYLCHACFLNLAERRLLLTSDRLSGY